MPLTIQEDSMRHAWVNKVGMLSLVGVMVLAGDSYAASKGLEHM